VDRFEKKVRADARWLGFVILTMLIFAGSTPPPFGVFDIAVAIYAVTELVRLVRSEQRAQKLLAELL
jgi:hypothetical protein